MADRKGLFIRPSVWYRYSYPTICVKSRKWYLYNQMRRVAMSPDRSPECRADSERRIGLWLKSRRHLTRTTENRRRVVAFKRMVRERVVRMGENSSPSSSAPKHHPSSATTTAGSPQTFRSWAIGSSNAMMRSISIQRFIRIG